MTNDLTFITNTLFDNVTFDNEANCWLFTFANKIYASSSGFWRLLKHNKIIFISVDNKQVFGLTKPIDLAGELRIILAGKYLINIEVIKNTFDLILMLTDGLKLEIFISSLGYENYEFLINEKRYIGLGLGHCNNGHLTRITAGNKSIYKKRADSCYSAK